MQVGSGKGRNKIYKKNGAPKLKGGEYIISELYEKCCVLFRKKGDKLFEVIFEKGKGDIYLTNRRFIYIRPPLAWYKRGTTTGKSGGALLITLFDSAANYDEVKEMKEKRIFEFIEFEFKEDYKLEFSFLRGARIELNNKIGEFYIVTKKIVIDEIERIQNEEMEGLEENDH